MNFFDKVKNLFMSEPEMPVMAAEGTIVRNQIVRVSAAISPDGRASSGRRSVTLITEYRGVQTGEANYQRGVVAVTKNVGDDFWIANRMVVEPSSALVTAVNGIPPVEVMEQGVAA